MELVSVYLQSSRVLQFQHVLQMWNEGKVKATPEIASFIEKDCQLTRHDFNLKHFDSVDVNNTEAVCESLLAWTIFCIDSQRFDELNEILKYARTQYLN
ncbi:hypothetical protein ACWA2C_16255 [Priestia megaterium]